jgi:hypothetical protein
VNFVQNCECANCFSFIVESILYRGKGAFVLVRYSSGVLLVLEVLDFVSAIVFQDGIQQVSDEGDVLYVFPKDYRVKLAAKSFRFKIEPVIEKTKVLILVTCVEIHSVS